LSLRLECATLVDVMPKRRLVPRTEMPAPKADLKELRDALKREAIANAARDLRLTAAWNFEDRQPG